MLEYNSVVARNAGILRKYYENCNYRLCEYSVGVKLMWRQDLKSEWAEAAGCLIVRSHVNGTYMFDYPVAGPDGDEEKALLEIERDCSERGIQLMFTVIPDSKAHVLLERYPYVHVYNIRTWKDYVYEASSLQNFAGRKYSGQRNHINKFYAAHPDVRFKRLTQDDLGAIDRFFEEYTAMFSKNDMEKAKVELRNARTMLKMTGNPWFKTGGFFDGNRLIALCLSEKCGETMIDHIEKALYTYQGIYPALVQAFAKEFGCGVRYFNREDDAADPGLRTSKLQYHPCCLASKFNIKPINDLQENVRKIPTLTTERLTLDEIREEDIPRYNRLVLDRERNKWWGFDDVAALGGPVEERSFYEVAECDFENRIALNFAVRLDGVMIGEAVIYNFDFRGGAELGCRIDSEYAGNGYGTEAFQAAANWALYKVNMVRIVAKCYHQNTASFHMLSSCMKKIGEDETFQYFEKTI